MFWLRAVSAFLIVLALAPPPLEAQEQRCFPETSYCISGRIRAFWEQNGGLPVFGFPVGPQQEEQVEGRPVQVQWFERNRLELHPENLHPYDVLLGRLGVDRLAQQGRPDWQNFARIPQQGDCQSFETGHSVCGAILAAWRASGLEFDGRPGTSEAESLALFGLPISSPALEALERQVSMVQWFERARFELHPENQPPYHVLLGLLGNEIRQTAQAAPASRSAEISSPTVVGGQVFFVANDGIHGGELWASDGTGQGTRAVALGNRLFFVADDGIHGGELWVSDGTPAGTAMLKDINTNSAQ